MLDPEGRERDVAVSGTHQTFECLLSGEVRADGEHLLDRRVLDVHRGLEGCHVVVARHVGHCSAVLHIFTRGGTRKASVCFLLYTQDEVPKRCTLSQLTLCLSACQ